MNINIVDILLVLGVLYLFMDSNSSYFRLARLRFNIFRKSIFE